MNATSLPLAIPLYRPWWRRLADLFSRDACLAGSPASGSAAAPCSFTERDYRALRDLSQGTLRDIGAPGWVAERREVVRRLDLDLLRL